uniref:Uncharacterized protein n=1 Tax=Peronospora matthiolae TaxID=2874970 RepID=A0AAV1VLZ3_9STRA
MRRKKRQRSESFQVDQGSDGDTRKRLEVFHAQLFDLPQEEPSVEASETPHVRLKSKTRRLKRQLTRDDVVGDQEVVPLVKLVASKKDKRKKKKKREEVEQVETVEKEQTKQKNKKKVIGAVDSAVAKPLKSSNKEQSIVLQRVKCQEAAVKIVQAPQWHRLQTDCARNGDADGVDVLEQALGGVKEVAMKKMDRLSREKHRAVVADETSAVLKVENMKEAGIAAGMMDAAVEKDATCNEPSKRVTKKQKQKKRLVLSSSERTAEEDANMPVIRENEEVAGSGNSGKAAKFVELKACRKQKETKRALAKHNGESSPKAPPKPRQPKQGKHVGSSGMAEGVDKAVPKKGQTVPGKKVQISGKCVIADVLLENADTEDDEFPSIHQETRRGFSASYKSIDKVAISQVSDESSPESIGDSDDDCDRNNTGSSSLYSRLIDSAARERWELVEVGRLVRLFAAEWEYEESATARFLCETCPELVSVDFLEGLGVNLSAKQLIEIFEIGSGNAGVFMNKIASAVENGDLSMRDPHFIATLERRVALMELNAEVLELLYPLLESLSTVRDVGYLLQQLCEHWQLERKLALVQQALLSKVFDDLDGNQDEILLDLPDLAGRLDFPSRLDQEDVDENGNLRGFLVNDDSDLSGEEASGEEDDENDSDDDGNPYDGESESDGDATGRTPGSNRFIEEEADVGEDDDDDDDVEDEEDEIERRSQNASSSSDSD